MRFSVSLAREGDRVVARCNEVDRAAEGASRKEALAALRQALHEYLTRARAVAAPPAPDVDVELVVVADDTSASLAGGCGSHSVEELAREGAEAGGYFKPSGSVERILVATNLDADVSPPLAAAVAPFMDAATELALVHVRSQPERFLHGTDRDDQRDVLDREARSRLEQWSSGFLPRCPRELLLEAAALPVDGIAHAIERWRADLVVVAASEGSGFLRTLLGAVADRVVRHASTNVLVARVSPASAVVLVATDLSDPSFGAVAAAGEEARRRRGTVIVLHVLDGAAPFSASGSLPPLYEQRANARSSVHHAMAKTGVHGDVEIDEGSAARQIVAQAAARGAELVVVASHGRTGLSRVLLGSVAEEVTRDAPCSVLVVRR